jgi:hypothetical protein
MNVIHVDECSTGGKSASKKLTSSAVSTASKASSRSQSTSKNNSNNTSRNGDDDDDGFGSSSDDEEEARQIDVAESAELHFNQIMALVERSCSKKPKEQQQQLNASVQKSNSISRSASSEQQGVMNVPCMVLSGEDSDLEIDDTTAPATATATVTVNYAKKNSVFNRDTDLGDDNYQNTSGNNSSSNSPTGSPRFPALHALTIPHASHSSICSPEAYLGAHSSGQSRSSSRAATPTAVALKNLVREHIFGILNFGTADQVMQVL